LRSRLKDVEGAQFMKQKTATIAGFLLAPMVPVVVMCALDPPRAQWLSLYFLIAAIIYFNAMAIMLVVGAPVYLLFKRWSLIKWWSVPIVGFAVGAWVGHLYRLPFRPTVMASVLIQGGACALAGLVFWLIWRMGRSSTVLSEQ
jgi:hypothetical protein